MPQKMLSCICGNTELERIGVNLLRRDDNEPDSLGLVALICKGNGCGRVTFRPDDMTTPIAKNGHGQDREWLKQLISLFEHVYMERFVYKAIAERDPACPTLLEALKKDKDIVFGMNSKFKAIHECINKPEEMMKLLSELPSLSVPVSRSETKSTGK